MKPRELPGAKEQDLGLLSRNIRYLDQEKQKSILL